MTTYDLRPIGHVRGPLRTRDEAPKQGDEGAPDADLVFDDDVIDAVRNLTPGDEVIVLTWLHQGDRSVLAVHPRDDASRPLTGVFSTRSSDRPNPIGLHRVTVLHVDGPRVHVSGIEAIDGTPIVDVKPVLDPSDR